MPRDKSRHAAGDLAFRRDSASLVIVERDGDLYEAIAIEELQPTKGAPLAPSVVVKHFALILQTYGVQSIMVDQFYIESARELFAEHEIEIVEAPSGQDGKSRTYLAAKALLAEGRVVLPYHRRLRDQLKSVIAKPTPGGGLQISTPRRGSSSGHGDLVSALVLALWKAREHSSTFVERMRVLRESGDLDDNWPTHRRGY